MFTWLSELKTVTNPNGTTRYYIKKGELIMITLKGSIAFTVKEATKWKRKGYSVVKIRKQAGDWLITLAILPPSLKECAI